MSQFSLIIFVLLISCIYAYFLLPPKELIHRRRLSDSINPEFSSQSTRRVKNSAVNSPTTRLSRSSDGPIQANYSLTKGVEFPSNLNGSEIRVGIIMTRWNSDIIQRLHEVSSYLSKKYLRDFTFKTVGSKRVLSRLWSKTF